MTSKKVCARCQQLLSREMFRMRERRDRGGRQEWGRVCKGCLQPTRKLDGAAEPYVPAAILFPKASQLTRHWRGDEVAASPAMRERFGF
jgi:hypothetical protein